MSQTLRSAKGLTELRIGIAEMAVSDEPDETLVTYSLGSCIGLSLYDSNLGLAGMIHCMMPLASESNRDALKNPCLFVDTGVVHLLSEMFKLGARSEHMAAKVAGAASNMDEGRLFRIGDRNYAVLRRVLWKNDILIAGEDIGGDEARTLALEVSSGRTFVKKRGVIVQI